MIKTAHANNSIRVPKQVKEVLNSYFEKIEKKLPNKLESLYLFGSVSIGAYQEGLSDIDFYAVTKEKQILKENNTGAPHQKAKTPRGPHKAPKALKRI